MKNYYYLVVAVVLMAISFFVGRCTIDTKTKIEYVKGETKIDTVKIPEPYKVEVPSDPILPMIPDTIKLPGNIEYRYMKVDTAQIIANYIALNYYEKVMFNNETDGKLTVGAQVQYNNLKEFSYEFTPMVKQITSVKSKVFIPFVTTSYNTFGYYGAGGGLYIKNVGAGVKYITDFNENGYEFSLNYKF